ncbi:hypothetical protein GOV05_03180 [Candidatus Woesearchaeota archaeon]|nr:hypothetical protein [Candidatus Woesearchaeota archaeon]
MKISILGPSNVEEWLEKLGKSHDEVMVLVDRVVDSVISLEHEIVITPHKNSLPTTFSYKYKDLGGKKVFGVIPMDDVEFGITHLDDEAYDETINSVTWRNQPEKQLEESDALLVLGFGPGVLVELGQAKWFGKPKIIVVEEFITAKLPIESIRNLNVTYCKADDVERFLLEKK